MLDANMRPRPTLPVLIVLLAVILVGCSSRRVYQTTSNIAPPSADAVNINTASVDELEKLPHIGRKTAEAIVGFRAQNGPFRRIENLLQIRGISERRFMEIRRSLRTE